MCKFSREMKHAVQNVWGNTNGPLLFTCFGGCRKCGVWWAIMPRFQGPARPKWEILFSRGEKPLNPAQFATCPPSVFRHSRQANSALSGPKFRAGGPKFCTGPIICTSSKFCLVLDLINKFLQNCASVREVSVLILKTANLAWPVPVE